MLCCRNTKSFFLQTEHDEMTTECKQWVVTDRATHITVTPQSDEFIESLVSMIPDLIYHHNTVKQ
jgi:hypothetical protein